MLDGFYKWYRNTTKRPLLLELNPEYHGVVLFDPTSYPDVWLAVYQRHYHVLVLKGELMKGPHRALLHYKPHKELPTIKIGAAQIIDASFYDEAAIAAELKDNIKYKRYFATDASREMLVPLEPEREI